MNKVNSCIFITRVIDFCLREVKQKIFFGCLRSDLKVSRDWDSWKRYHNRWRFEKTRKNFQDLKTLDDYRYKTSSFEKSNLIKFRSTASSEIIRFPYPFKIIKNIWKNLLYNNINRIIHKINPLWVLLLLCELNYFWLWSMLQTSMFFFGKLSENPDSEILKNFERFLRYFNKRDLWLRRYEKDET